jgi:hypothetical protein
MVLLVLPHEDTQAQDFMSAVENCGGFCLLGIRPGKTRAGETIQHLETHPWVTDVQQNATGNGYSTISWQWNGRQPDVIDETKRGRATFYWVDENVIPLNDSVIETVTVYTKIRHFSLHTWLGEADSGSATFRPDGKLGYSVFYDLQGGILNLNVEIACPFSLMSYWNTQTRITLSIGRATAGFVHPGQLTSICSLSHG